jgi:serine/threonine-protein kinase
MNELDAQVIPGTEGARHPFFSPDGEWIGFDATETGIRKVSVHGGFPKTLTDDINRMYGATWSENGTIVFSTSGESGVQSGKLVKISANGGALEDILVADDDATAFRWPHFLPGGQSVLFSVGEQGNQMGDGNIALLSLGSEEYQTLIIGGYNAKYASTGHIVFMRNDTVWAVPFDVAAGKITGEESPLFNGLEYNSGPGAAIYDFSDDGLLVYLLGKDVSVFFLGPRYPVWVDRQGNEERVNVAPANYWAPRISADGRQAVVGVVDAGNVDIWTIDLEREISSRLTFGAEYDGNAFWSPDGDRIIYTSGSDGGAIYSRAADGTGSPELINKNDIATDLEAVSPDGERLIVIDNLRGESDIYQLSLSGESFPQPLVSTPFDEDSVEISPDGRYIAYNSNETGNREVYVRTFPNPDNGRWQISTNGGYDPMWNPNGAELFFRAGAAASIYAVNVQTEPKFSLTEPRLIVEGNYIAFPYSYAVSADGERFLMFKDAELPANADSPGPQSSKLAIVENWFEELKKIKPTDASN